MAILRMSDLDLAQKRVLIREDLNVPLDHGVITSDARIEAVIPTLQQALKANAAIIIVSHLGRPKEGMVDQALSLEPVAKRLAELLEHSVRFEKDWLDGIDLAPGEIVLCENVRFNHGAASNDEELAKKIAALCDIFVMDAFATAHRAQASTHGVAKYAPIACAGPLLLAELEALERVLKSPKKPVVAIVGGSKVSTKFGVLENLLTKVDHLIVGGGIANTFLAATGVNVGKSLYEPDQMEQARKLLKLGEQRGVEIPLPHDVVVGQTFSAEAKAVVKPLTEITDLDMIFDIGPDTIAYMTSLLEDAGTILWNGPVGVFEFDQFAKGTAALARAISLSPAFSIAGGGDTLAAIEKYDISEKISYISTGGGAFLQYLQGKPLPAVAILQQRAGDFHDAN